MMPGHSYDGVRVQVDVNLTVHDTNYLRLLLECQAPRLAGNHVSNIFTKLRVADRAQAIVRAREAGFGQDTS
jgi:hypothetical protein